LGYGKHIAVDLLMFLLEVLHEDLNRILNKPYVQNDDHGLSDEEEAARSWADYTKRNQSIIVDKFVGQVKTISKCCECNTTTRTFDPYFVFQVKSETNEENYCSKCKDFKQSKMKQTLFKAGETLRSLNVPKRIASNRSGRSTQLGLEIMICML
jgi:ubiquitin C-terminal hydrolase